MYRRRHQIENFFARITEFRAAATRYDKKDGRELRGSSSSRRWRYSSDMNVNGPQYMKNVSELMDSVKGAFGGSDLDKTPYAPVAGD